MSYDEIFRTSCLQQPDDCVQVEIDTFNNSAFITVVEDEVERCVELNVDDVRALRDALTEWLAGE